MWPVRLALSKTRLGLAPEVDVSNTTGLRVAADVVPVTRAVKFGVD